MDSYNDVAMLKAKLAQEELEFQVFKEESVTLTSPWPLLNELLNGAATPHRPLNPVFKSERRKIVDLSDTAVQPSVTANEMVSEAAAASANTEHTANDLSHILKKASR